MITNSQHGENRDRPWQPLRRQRLRISNACHACRLRKVKCDGIRPACARCQERRKACTYSRDSGQQAKDRFPAGQTPPNRSHYPILDSPPGVSLQTHLLEASSNSAIETPSTTSSSSMFERFEEGYGLDSDPNRAYYTAHGRFAGEVAAAIDVRAGIAPTAASNLVPFVDAPLFGEIDLHYPYRTPDFAAELPPRPYADRLVNIYWQHVDHVEPVLDRERFSRDYEALYSRSEVSSEVWPSILNVVFALAVQRQEHIPLQRRDEEGNIFFKRAWALLRPETVLWQPGSLELVQCLMLMNRYLHCTNNQQKTWMTAGLAVRIAQSICCHLPEASSTKDSASDKELKQRVWINCVALDRCVSWSLGRTSAPCLILFPYKTDSMCTRSSCQQGDKHDESLTWKLELHEISNHIQLAQTQVRNNLAAKLGLPRLYQQDEYHAVAVQLDACLTKWENSLPSNWMLENLQSVVDRTSRAERYLLHLRFLHSRIFLYRPMLGRFYLMKSHAATVQTAANPPSLSDRLLREGARMCVEAAQKVASLVIETLEPDEPIGLLPWWYRIYYLHIAGINFLAAMFGSDLFTESVSQSWHGVISALRAHEHLSAYVKPCIRTFEILSARILNTQYPTPDGSSGVAIEDGVAGPLFDDIFQDMDFDFDNFLFGTDDIIWGQL